MSSIPALNLLRTQASAPDRPAPQAGPNLFQIRNLNYRYPDGTLALNGLDLDIPAGDRMALVGPNGAGKTTLIKHLCGLNHPSAGNVHYQGRPLSDQHLDEAQLQIGLLFQDPDDQLFGHTVIDDVAFGPGNQGHSEPQARALAQQALARVSLDHLAYKPPHNLSFGQKKRAALAGLLAMQPQVLILDEPTANLDPGQEEVFLQILRDFPGTLICISHDLIFLFELCSRAVVLDQGRVLQDTSMRHLVSRRRDLRRLGLDFSFRFSPELRLAQTGDQEEAQAPSSPSPPPPPEAEVLAELKNLSYTYPDGTRALRKIDLSLHSRDRMALVGENGAGKTTLLSCLLGLRQGSGSFTFAGAPVTRKRRHRLWQQVGMVFQDCADQLFCPSVAEEVAFGLRNLKLSKPEIRKRTQTALEQVRLSGFEDRVPLHLSGGERKRLALACVLAMHPQVLILDEPTAGLDPQAEKMLVDIVRDLACTLVLVSHDMYLVQALTRRTVVMHRGCIVRDVSTRSFLQDPNLASLNGLAYSYRQHNQDIIRHLQHVHEHNHVHRHLHEHMHRHNGYEHSHPHEHVHEHSHLFVHTHAHGQQGHVHHPSPSLHDHEHPDHELEPHEHEHE